MVVIFNFIYFSKKENEIALKIYIYIQKSIKDKKIKILENVKKIKNVPIKGGRSP